MRIVILEDDPADLRLFQEAVRSSRIDAEIYHFPDGASALARIRSAAAPWSPLPDLVFLDLNMPRVDGFEVLEILRDLPEYSQVPVAIFTSSRSPADMKRAFELHADRFVVKPNTLREFFDVVNSTIREFATVG